LSDCFAGTLHLDRAAVDAIWAEFDARDGEVARVQKMLEECARAVGRMSTTRLRSILFGNRTGGCNRVVCNDAAGLAETMLLAQLSALKLTDAKMTAKYAASLLGCDVETACSSLLASAQTADAAWTWETCGSLWRLGFAAATFMPRAPRLPDLKRRFNIANLTAVASTAAVA
jgi:hypothetical protein